MRSGYLFRGTKNPHSALLEFQLLNRGQNIIVCLVATTRYPQRVAIIQIKPNLNYDAF